MLVELFEEKEAFPKNAHPRKFQKRRHRFFWKMISYYFYRIHYPIRQLRGNRPKMPMLMICDSVSIFEWFDVLDLRFPVNVV